MIVYCLLPAREKNSGRERCEVSPRNHSELFNSFARNFSQGQQGITHEALDRILEEINKTIGVFLTVKKVGDFCYANYSMVSSRNFLHPYKLFKSLTLASGD